LNTRRLYVWQVVETFGFESDWIRLDGLRLEARGRAAGVSSEPFFMDYHLTTDAQANTHSLHVTVETVSDQHQLLLRRKNGAWTVNGEPRPDLECALDCDLAFCPVTNTMPVIRTGMHRNVEGSHDFVMAFVEVPSLRVVPSEQTYTVLARALGKVVIRYSSGSFSDDLTFDGDGFVVDYPTMARRIYPTDRETENAGATR
jgi:hypothetical protein